MKNHSYLKNIFKDQCGAVIVMVAILLFVLLGIAAFAIDIGYRHVVRNELQNAADAAALAATRELGKIYQNLSFAEQQVYVCDPDDIIPIAQQVALENYAGDASSLVVNSGDVVIGDWNYTTATFSATLDQPDAVRVTTRRDSSANGPISMFFARIFNFNTMNVTALATAAIGGQSTAEPGELELPIGISRSWFDAHPDDSFCGSTIAFSPSTNPDACAGWTTFKDAPANNPKIGDILDGLTTSPYTDTTVSFEYINGDLSEGVFESLMTAFQNHGYDVDAIYDPDNPSAVPQPVESDAERVPLTDADGNQLYYPPCSGASGCSGDERYAHEWPTTVVVYDSDDCTPSQDIRVAGFAQVVVYDVGQPSDKTVKARVNCDIVEPDPVRGGGGDYGIKGNIPGLVE